MKDRKSLTKSLHTVTVVSRVALHFMRHKQSADEAARGALLILGMPDDWPKSDETFVSCVAKIEALRKR